MMLTEIVSFIVASVAMHQGQAPLASPAPWSDFSSFSVVAALEEAAPKPDEIKDVDKWAKQPGRHSIGSRYLLLVDGSRGGVLISRSIPELQQALALPAALKAMPRCPKSMGAALSEYPSALAEYVASSVAEVFPYHTPPDGQLPSSTRFRVSATRKITLEANGTLFEIEPSDGSLWNLDKEGRKKFDEWLHEGDLKLQKRGANLNQAMNVAAAKFDEVRAHYGLRTMVLARPAGTKAGVTVANATKAYAELLTKLREEADVEWKPLQGDIESRFVQELGGYSEGSDWNSLSQREKDTIRAALGAYGQRGKLPGDLESILPNVRIVSSSLQFNIGVPLEGGGIFRVPLAPRK